MENCIFCKIAKGEIPSCKVYEDEKVLTFLDASPLTRGHCLVIPKEHFENIFDIGEATLREVISVGKIVAEKIKNNLKADGIRFSQSNGEAAGQVIPHFHLHIIPRYKNDGVQMSEMGVARPPKAEPQELEKIAEIIRKELN